MKKIPMRKCVATMTQAPKKDLLRIVRCTDGSIAVDATGKVNGRGAYLLKTQEAVEIAKKRKSLDRALECVVPQETYESILEVINEK